MSQLTGMSLTLSAWREREGSCAYKNRAEIHVEHSYELFQKAELMAAVTISRSSLYNAACALSSPALQILIILRYGNLRWKLFLYAGATL